MLRSRALILTALGCALAYSVFVRGYADYLAQVSPTRAVALYSMQPTALVALAEQHLRAGELESAEQYARRAIDANAYSGEAWRVLGAVAERAGRNEIALEHMRRAAALTPRDSGTQFWLGIHALRERRLDDALDRLDRLMRFQPETRNDVFPIMATVATNRAGVDAVAVRLAADPDWRSEFTTRLLREMPDPKIARDFVRALRRAGTELNVDEVNAYAFRLYNAQEAPALRDWLKEFDRDPGLLNNGGFDAVGPYRLLDWQIEQPPGTDIQLPRGADGKSVLRIDFHNQRIRFDGVRSTLLLPPGQYLLTGQVRSDLQAAHGLRWTLQCPSGQQHSELFAGKTPWRGFSMPVLVDDSCLLSTLKLEVYARIAAEQHLNGWIEFDEFKLLPTEELLGQ